MRIVAPVIVLSVAMATTASAQPADKPRLTATYDQGKGVVLATDDGTFRVRFSLRNQFRLEITRPTGDDAEASSKLSIPRTRLQFEGNVFGEDTRFKVELSLGDRGSFAFVKDVYVDQSLPGTTLAARVGQWKRPFNRQELVSDFALTLNERAITAEFVGGGRDLGVAIHNGYDRSPEGLEWVVGVFNSFSGGADRPLIDTTCTDEPAGFECATPAPTALPSDAGPALVARAGWNTGGVKGYSEGDLEGGPLRVAIGLNYKIDLADLSAGDEATVADNLSHGIGADALVKVEGLDVELGAYAMKVPSATTRFAAMIQAGYFLVAGKAQIAARFAWVPTTGKRKQLEARAAFSWYWQGHAWKWSTDLGVLQQTGTDPTTMTRAEPDLQLRSMAQLTF